MNSESINIYDRRLEHLQTSARLLALVAPAVSTSLGAEETELLLKKQKPEQEKSRRLLVKRIEERRKGVCSACGSLMIPGWTCSFWVESSHLPSKKGSKLKGKGKRAKTVKGNSQDQTSSQKKVCSIRPKCPIPAKKKILKKLVYACMRCNRQTVFEISDSTPPETRDIRKQDASYVIPVHSIQQRQSHNFGKDNITTNRNDDPNKGKETLKADSTTLSIDAQKKLFANASSKRRAKSRKQGALLATLNRNTTKDPLKTGLDLMDFMKPS